MALLKKMLFLLYVAFVFTGILSCKADGEDDAPMYTVTYQTAYGTAPTLFSVVSGTVLSSTQLPTLKADGWVFAGWYDGNTKALAGSYRVTKNVTLVAKWQKERYTVMYQSSYGSAPARISVEANTALTSEQLPELTYDGYAFEGWYDGDTKAVAESYHVNKNVTLVAKWTKMPRVNYNTSYGTCPSSIAIVPNTVLTSEQLPELTYDGYVFEGWYDSQNENASKLIAGNYTVTKDIYLYAKWTKNSAITIKIAEQQPDISLTSKEENGTVILTADTGFTNYAWRIDDKKQNETSNILTLNTATWTCGYYEVSVEAEKDGAFYSARAYITVGGN